MSPAETGPNRQELERLYHRYGSLILRRARRLMGDEQAARDAAQDVFVKLLRTKGQTMPESEVAWLYRVTTNCCLNLLRRARLWRRIARVLPAGAVSEPSLSLGMLLRGVPEGLQEIAIYYGVDQMSQDEIAAVLGLSQKTVSNRLHELRAYLGGGEPAESLGMR